jgi:hypothetical protein
VGGWDGFINMGKFALKPTRAVCALPHLFPLQATFSSSSLVYVEKSLLDTHQRPRLATYDSRSYGRSTVVSGQRGWANVLV